MRSPSSFRRCVALALLGAAACGEPAPDGEGDAPATPGTSESAAHAWPLSIYVPAAPTPRYERVILVTIDTLRADHVSSYGYRRKTTPFFDRLAERGVLFTRAQASVSHTAPSHATMLTGLPPALHGVLENGWELSPSAPDAARMFHRSGFETAAFLNVKFLMGITGGFEAVGVRALQGRRVVDATLHWLQNDRKNERFFLWVHLYDPHHWKTAVTETKHNLLAEWPEPTPDPEEFYDYLAELHGMPERVPGAPFVLPWKAQVQHKDELVTNTLEEYLRCVDAYDALTLYADRELERLYRTIEQLGLPGRSLWIVTSDHGEGLASHGIAGHGSRIYQEQLRVPLLFHASDGSIGPRTVDALVGHVDLLPTLAEVLGARIVADETLVDGRSLWPLLEGEEGDPQRVVFAERKPPEPDDEDRSTVFALQDARHKYLLHEPGEDEFYDLAADPRELVNRSGSGTPEEAALRRELEARIERYRARARPVSSDSKMPEEWLEELRSLGY